MLKRSVFILAALLVFTGAIIYALVELFSLRFQRGDVYPAYSTLRADALGTKALHDALVELESFSVDRNFWPLIKLRPEQPSTLIYAGVARRSMWDEQELKAFEALVTNGTRAVFAFAPEAASSPTFGARAPAGAGKRKPKLAPSPTTPPTPLEPEEAPPITPDPASSEPVPVEADPAAPAPDPAAPNATPATPPAGAAPVLVDEDEPLDEQLLDLREGVKFSDALRRWGAEFALPSRRAAGAHDRTAAVAGDAPDLEPETSWHSALYFKNVGDNWQTIYTCEGKPVVIEKPYGDGSIVLASDAYFLSNEALRKRRAPRLLAWLIGSPRQVLFDEEHHGVTEHANIATLTRKYRLHGVLAGLGLIACLFVWKNAVPLLPSRREQTAEVAEVTGKDAEEGFHNLLRRSIPPGQLLKICAAEWEKDCGHKATVAERLHLEAVLRALESRATRDPAAAYRTIVEGLSRTRHSPK